MNEEELVIAQMDLGQKKKKNIWFWIIIISAIALGFVILLVVGLYLLLNISNYGNPTYPFIPTPRNTIRSTTKEELLMNIALDTNEPAVKYSVISRRDLV